ncbi:MAG: hypothetical protein JJ891_16145 [Rhizobiaceae bacterium]|jgi:hypothetical protein|nr:hypothetical protein [Rhizobiaceae bacterium]
MRVIPWLTDHAITFIENFIADRISKYGIAPKLLEFGIGDSTLFFQDKTSKIIGFEHELHWYERVAEQLRLLGCHHAELHLLERPYSRFIEEIVGGEQFDVICIDGRDRVSCLDQVLKSNCLSESGVIVFDNTERISGAGQKYKEVLSMLETGFQCIHFEQIGRDRAGWNPTHRWITSVAWREECWQRTTLGLEL